MGNLQMVYPILTKSYDVFFVALFCFNFCYEGKNHAIFL